MIRAFQKADLEKVCELHQATFGKDRMSLDLLRLSSFYQKVFIDSPFADRSSPSLVYENRGKIEGFLGVLIRKFETKECSYRVGIGSRYMVSPHSSALVGASLLRSATRNNLDLFFTDGANDDGKKAMLALGGEEVPLFSFQWLKLFRPFQFFAQRLRKKSFLLGLGGRLVSPFLDASVGFLPRSFFKANIGGSPSQPCGATEILNLYSQVAKSFQVLPSYKKDELEWLIQFCRKWKQRGEFHLRIVNFGEGGTGGFSGYLRQDGIFEVLNIWASPKRCGDLLDSLFCFVKKRNGVGVQGQISGGLLSHLRERSVIFKKGSWALAKSKNHVLLHLLHSGKIYIGGFEGELWLPSGRRGHA